MDRDAAVYLAKLGVEAERYDEALEEMKRVAAMNVELNTEEMNLIAAAFKNATELRRVSWRELSLAAEKEKAKGNRVNVKRVMGYMHKVETEVQISSLPLIFMSSHYALLNNAKSSTTRSDSYRYCAELKTGAERDALAQQARENYDMAVKIAEEALHLTDPTRLGLALNLSVLYYEFLNSLEMASEIALRAYNEAKPELDSVLGGEEQKKSYRILKIIEDNLSLWAAKEAEQQAVNVCRGVLD